jgi:hypothetical protein
MAILYAPKGYKDLNPTEKERICNGAGPAHFGWLVPDTIWGLSITEAANIHDFMYWAGKTLEDKEEADRVFLNNMVRLIESKTSFIGMALNPLRLHRAGLYFKAVDQFGGPAFWAGKNTKETLMSVARIVRKVT